MGRYPGGRRPRDRGEHDNPARGRHASTALLAGASGQWQPGERLQNRDTELGWRLRAVAFRSEQHLLRWLWGLNHRNGGLLHHPDVCLLLGPATAHLRQCDCLPGHRGERCWILNRSKWTADRIRHCTNEPSGHPRSPSPGPVPDRRVPNHRRHASHRRLGCCPHRWQPHSLL